MKQIKTLALVAVLAAATWSCTSTAETTEESTATMALPDGEMAINSDGSTVEWKGEVLGMKSHTGTVKLTEGNLTVKGGAITGGKFSVDLSTITPTDSTYDADNTREKLVGHLSSPDFFNVAEFPTATFEITEVMGTDLKGNLTIRGISHEETVKNVAIDAEAGTVSGILTFDRSKYDVSFKMPVADLVLSNDIPLNVTIAIAK
ncbi:YceI family protein [Lacihabitans sp. LS3-19]|uniref:YceI family protein n=1 Tax=Lacihabitans sp. LS3-19 TaxID=2487335 RepID=UPI0020CBD14D|nr:YceI family protein [Lacihabitans sp. LS3-19]MCP9768482.1 YceI family protein [Lacihabitans sp. LS3-19]